MENLQQANPSPAPIKISLIVPVYNTGPYLSVCLDSLLSQTLEEIEIICIDDGSTDSSLDVLKQYSAKDSRIRLLSQPNSGASVARNNGMETARGQYIGFVDSDDLIHPSFCKKLWTLVEKHQADMVFCDFITGERETSFPIETQACPSPPEVFDVSPAHFSRFPIVIWNRIIRKSLLDKYNIRFDRELNYAEDFCFHHMVMPFCSTVSRIHEKLYYYRQREESLMHSRELYRKTHLRDQMKALKNVWLFLQYHQFQKTYKTEFLKITLSCIRHIRKTASPSERKEATKAVIDFFRENSLYNEKEDAHRLPFRKRIILRSWQSGKEDIDLTYQWKQFLKNLKRLIFPDR